MRWVARALLSCAASLLLLGLAQAQDATRARLITVPDAQALSDHFPPVALVTAVSGRVVLACDVAVDGESECRAAEEVPAAMGFGPAAEAVARDWRFSPRVENGTPVASQVRIPIEFTNENTEPFVMKGTLSVDAVSGRPPVTSNETDPTPDEMRQLVCNWARLEGCPSGSTSSRLPEDANMRFFPAGARAANVRGRALVACAIRSDRTPDCAVERESQSGLGFGDAALSLVLHVIEGGGDAVEPGSAFRVPVDFALREGRRRSNFNWMWSELPTGSSFARYYPRSALERRVEGTVRMVCAIREDRRLNCAVVSQTPADEGFGYAAVMISRDFQISEEALGQPGLAVGDRIPLPIRFNIG